MLDDYRYKGMITWNFKNSIWMRTWGVSTSPDTFFYLLLHGRSSPSRRRHHIAGPDIENQHKRQRRGLNAAGRPGIPICDKYPFRHKTGRIL